MRIYRPRLLITGRAGSGQQHLGRAVLHHLEGYHVQTLNLGMLLGSSTSTAEASIVQAVLEARRHKPAVLYLPDVELWESSLTQSTINTLRSVLLTIAPHEPIILFGLANDILDETSYWLQDLFGAKSTMTLTTPSIDERFTFFNFLVDFITSSPADLPDAQPKRKRVLETLAIAPPPPVRLPTKAERKGLENKDRKLKLLLKAKLSPLMELIRTRYKRFKKASIVSFY